jgi:hypothetical protein
MLYRHRTSTTSCHMLRDRPSCRCEAKSGKVRKQQALQCFTGIKACFSTQLTDGLRWTLDHCCTNNGRRRLLISSPTDYAGRSDDHCCIDDGLRRLLISSLTDYAGRSIAAASTTDFDGFSSAHQRTTLDHRSLLHRRRTSTASHRRTDGLRWTLDHCFIDDGPRRLLIMFYGTDCRARYEAKDGKVRTNQAPQCFTGFKACRRICEQGCSKFV